MACLLEHTAHLQFLSGLCFPGPDEKSRADSVELVRLVHEGRFTLLKSYDMFGAYFGCAAELYEMVPALHKFYATCELEMSTGRDLGCAAEFSRLHQEISSWTPPQDPLDSLYQHTDAWFNDLGGYERPEDRAARAEAERARKASESAMVASAYVIQKTLLLFLISAYMRRSEDHDRLVVATRPIVDEALDIYDQIRGTTWENTTWWPIVIVGSYTTAPEQRNRFLHGFRSFKPPMGIVLRGMELLQKVWDAPDDVFGLSGLSRLVGDSGAYCFG